MGKPSRELKNKKDIKILWAETFNRCMFNENGNFCVNQTIESKQDREKYTLAEQAHISPHGKQGPRSGTKNETKDGHENRLVLCPTHHKIVDEDPKKYTHEIMYEMKERHISHYSEILNNIPSQIVSKFSIKIQSDKFLDLVEYLNTFIVNKKSSKIEKEALFKSLNENTTLLRHFLHNQNDARLFSEIKDKLISTIITNKRDEELKFKLLDYFTKNCIQSYSDEIIEILGNIIKNTENIVLMRSIGLFIERLELKTRFDQLTNVVCGLISNADQMIKEFTIRSIMKFINNFTKEQLEKILKAMFYTKGSKEDVTQHGLSLSLKFSGKDLQDASFRESIKFLGKVLQNPKYTLDFFDEIMVVYDSILKKDQGKFKDTGKIQYTYSWRLPNNFSKDEAHFEHESDKTKRVAFEIYNIFKKLNETDKSILKQVFDKIISNARYLIYYELLNRFLANKIEEYSEVVERMIFMQDLWHIIPILEANRYQMFKLYFEKYPQKISSFEKQILIYSIPDNIGKEFNIKAEFATIIVDSQVSDSFKTDSMRKIKQEYEEKIGEEHNIPEFKLQERKRDDDSIFATVHKTFDESQINTRKEVDELFSIITKYAQSSSIFDKDIGDLADPFQKYIAKNTDQLKPLYEKIKTLSLKERGIWLISSLARGALESIEENLKEDLPAFYNEIFNIYNIFSDTSNSNESDARLRIARTLNKNEFLRNKATGELQETNPELFKKVKELVIQIAKDPDPINDEDKEADGLNSVKGEATALVCILAFYYPNDKDLESIIKDLSKENNAGIQAQLIQNLVYLIPDDKNYTLCKEIIDNLKKSEEYIIQGAIIRYMYRLGNKKLAENKNLIEYFCGINNKEISSQIGDLIGQVLIHGVDIKEIFEKIINDKLGNEELLESIALEFQNSLPNIISTIKLKESKRSLGYFKQLIGYFSENQENLKAVRSRLGFCFHDPKKLGEKSFSILEKEKILEKLIKIPHADVQRNLNEYFLFFIEHNLHTEKILDYLLMQTEFKLNEKIPVMLVDGWLNDGIIKILKHIYKENKSGNIDKRIFAKAEKLFDEGLRYGENGFYEIFDQYYREV